MATRDRDDEEIVTLGAELVRARATADVLRERFQWSKVQTPQPWRPTVVGEELIGYFGGKTLKNGAFGQYEVVIVHVPHHGAILASGTEIIQLIDAACVAKGHPIRVVWEGMEEIGNKGHKKKRYALFVAQGDPIQPEDLPEVRT